MGGQLGSRRLCHRKSGSKGSNRNNTQTSIRTAHRASFLLFVLVVIPTLLPLNAGAESISVIQRVLANQQPSSSGTVTISLSKATGAGHALIVGVSFWPVDISSVSDSSGDVFTRGIATSFYHNVSQGVMYTNFYYAKSTAGGATSIT